MLLYKDGITIEIFPPADIAVYKRIGYVQVVENPNSVPVEEVKEDPQQSTDQVTVEEIEPEKEGE